MVCYLYISFLILLIASDQRTLLWQMTDPTEYVSDVSCQHGALQGVSTAEEGCGADAKRAYKDMTLCTC